MKDNVIIKGNQHGIMLQMNETADFLSIKQELATKLKKANQFFGDSQVIISFKGRHLDAVQENQLIDVIQSSSQMKVLCLAEDGRKYRSKKEQALKEVVQLLESKTTQTAVFHHNTLRSGQKLSEDHSLIIMGDVNNGAVVESSGSVVVLGRLKGVVHCGLGQSNKSFIVALDMQPVQLRIGNVYGRSSDEQVLDAKHYEPKIAYVQDERIVIEPISNKSALATLKD